MAMLNFEAKRETLLPYLPAGTEPEDWNGTYFVSLAAFAALNVKIYNKISIPFHGSFEEVNLRFYVKKNLDSEKHGVVYIRQILPKRAAAFLGKKIFFQNSARMRMHHTVTPASPGKSLSVEYFWKSPAQWNSLCMETDGEARLPSDGSAAKFMLDRSLVYVRHPSGITLEQKMPHPPWRVWRSSPKIICDMEEVFGPELRETLSVPVSSFLVEGSSMRIHRPEAVF